MIVTVEVRSARSTDNKKFLRVSGYSYKAIGQIVISFTNIHFSLLVYSSPSSMDLCPF